MARGWRRQALACAVLSERSHPSRRSAPMQRFAFTALALVLAPLSAGCDKGECGNGRIDESYVVNGADEACDDGNTVSGDGCSDSCQAEPGYTCSADACEPICGDGLFLPGVEVCEGVGCFRCEEPEGNYVCDENGVCEPICGDHVAIDPEQCDDGN